MLSVGIVGLPNVGKSTLFNALTRGQAEVSNYPFTTIDRNVGVVAVPDPRLGELARRVEPLETTPSFLEMVDIAGLVEGASRGEGLGNQFLGHIREVDALAHVLRCFAESDIAHVVGAVDPVRDAEVVETELLLADLELLGRVIDKRERQWKASPKEGAAERRRLAAWREALEAGRPLAALDLDREALDELATLGLLTCRPTLYVANVSEDEIAGEEGEPLAALRAWLAGRGEAPPVPISARIEGELLELEPGERAELMADLGLDRTGLDRLVEACFERLDLIRFYTVANRKLRAWSVPRGTSAPRAAGRIHTDMEHGFIRARVVAYDDLLEAGGWHGAAQAGHLRTEGKSYEVRDGDVIEFLFQPA